MRELGMGVTFDKLFDLMPLLLRIPDLLAPGADTVEASQGPHFGQSLLQLFPQPSLLPGCKKQFAFAPVQVPGGYRSESIGGDERTEDSRCRRTEPINHDNAGHAQQAVNEGNGGLIDQWQGDDTVANQ